MRCRMKGCNKQSKMAFMRKHNGKTHVFYYCKEHAPQGSKSIVGRVMQCGHPVSCLAGNDTTHYCRCCEEEARK